MSFPNPDIRLKKEFGGVKKALEYCVEMNMNKTQAAFFLQIDRKTLRNRAARFHITFPDGYATRDNTLLSEVNSKYMRKGNQNGTMGGRQRWRKHVTTTT